MKTTFYSLFVALLFTTNVKAQSKESRNKMKKQILIDKFFIPNLNNSQK